MPRNPLAEPLVVWLDPVPLRDELPSVLVLNPEILPSQLRPWVEDIAERMSCPIDFVAIPAMVSAGAVIGRRVGIRPQRYTTWMEVPNVWAVVIAPPGAIKTPAANEAVGPIRWLEGKAAEKHEADVADFKALESLHKMERDLAEKDARAALKNDRDAALGVLQAVTEPNAPVAKRYITSDATMEKLGEICAANPMGVMVHRDELLSLFAELDQPEKASARGFFLSGWNGQEGYTFDRISRGTIRIQAVNLSIFGTAQPNRLARYMRESLQRFDDGMVQRLQLLVWPDCKGEFREVDRHPNSEAKRAAYECYADLADLDLQELGAQWDEDTGSGGRPFLRFDERAQDAFSVWRHDLERRLRSGELSPAMVSHLAKYRGLIPRLALICHLANKGIGPVSYEAIQQAFGWAEYLESHAQRAYASLSCDNADAARAIWRRIIKGDLPEFFTARDIQRKGWSGLTDKDRVAAGLEALFDAHWIMGFEEKTGGRPTMQYLANPKALRNWNG